jgi:Fic family protein
MHHLRFAHIHPFSDGNGRTARLVEKWFLAQKLGKNYWKIQSEKHYWENRQKYYEAINCGVNFYELDYSMCIDFAEILVESLKV